MPDMRTFATATLALGLSLGLVACGSSDIEPAADVEAEAAPSIAVAADEPAQPQTPPVATPTPDPLADPCGADRVAPWIGREATVPVRLEVVAAADPGADRWIYPDSMVTQDHRADRLNVMMEKETDIIVSARCG